MSHEGPEKKLVYKLNQITTFFAHEPDDTAIDQIAEHLGKFWEKRMREKIINLAATGQHGMLPRAFEAVKKLS